MASKIKYTRNTTTSLKVVGTIDTDNETIEVDGEEKKNTGDTGRIRGNIAGELE